MYRFSKIQNFQNLETEHRNHYCKWKLKNIPLKMMNFIKNGKLDTLRHEKSADIR